MLAILYLLLISINMQAQKQASIHGEYYLAGVMETASGFKLNADSSFEFFFSQGALDRYGKGTYTVKQNKLLLNSTQKQGKDFTLINSKNDQVGKTTIQVTEQNNVVLKYVFVRVTTGGSVKEGFLSDEGIFVYEGSRPDTIELTFKFCPEKTAVFTGLPKEHNYFEFKFEPWIMEFYFNNFTLDIGGDELTGAHPMLEGNKFRYTKNSDE